MRATAHRTTAFSVVRMRFVFVALLRRTTVESESCVICSMRSSQIAELIAPNVSTNRNCKRTNHYKPSIQIKAQEREKAAQHEVVGERRIGRPHLRFQVEYDSTRVKDKRHPHLREC